MVEAARKYSRVVQLGTQSRSSASLARAAELVIDSNHAVNTTDGDGIMKRHTHENNEDHESPITEVEAFALCYKEQAKDVAETLRKEALAYYKELQGEDNHDD
jgi:predicted dehydrogenase